MSLPITTPADYTGYVGISSNQFKEENLENYIATYEQRYLLELLNAQAYNDISTQSPLDQKYLDLINGVEWIDCDGDKRYNLGLKEVLLRFIYYHFVSDNFINSDTGMVRNKNENSDYVGDTYNRQMCNQKYNDGISIYEDYVVPFINQFYRISEPVTGYVDNGGGDYTILAASTKYLVNGDTISLNNNTYVVSNLVSDTSFDIVASGPGLVFSGDFTYEPYEDYNLCKIRRTWL